MGNVLVLYDSASGNTAKMAGLVAEGAASIPEIEVRLRAVAEATAEDVLWCDGLALGSEGFEVLGGGPVAADGLAAVAVVEPLGPVMQIDGHLADPETRRDSPLARGHETLSCARFVHQMCTRRRFLRAVFVTQLDSI
jgi:hypothetical protein